MAEPRGRAEPWDGLRRASVRLVDPANVRVWGTGFFIARDVLLTSWHLVRDVPEQRVQVQQPAAGQGAASSLAWQILGEATLLEEGRHRDLALLSFRYTGADTTGYQAQPPVVLPLGEQDPPPGAQLLSSGFPEDAASHHDATYEATGRTTPQGQSVEFLRFKGDGVVSGVSGAALVEAVTGRVCGVIVRNELVGGAIDGGLAVPLADFRDAFPEYGETVLSSNSLVCQEGATAAQSSFGRPDWSWPTAWDFRSYREEKRQGFVGRSWLFEDVRAWALNPDPLAPRALLIAADYGVGKSAFLAELLATDAAGLPVAAHHFCTSEQEATLTPALFVRNLAVQLAHALPAYRQALEAEEAKEPRQWLDEAERDPSRAFDQAILAPLLKIDSPSTALLWVVDALDEAQEVRAGGSPGAQLTIVQLLARNASRLPRWIKVLATSRRRPDALNPLLQAFSLQTLVAEEARNLEDLFTYALARCQRSPLAERLKQVGLSAEEVARFLSDQKQSSGKFLYVVRVLNDLASGQLPLQSRQNLEQLPPGMDRFYRDAFERRFPNEESYAPVRDILGVLCEQREPLGRRELAAILSGSGQTISEREILDWLKPMHDLLRLVSRTEQINGDQCQIVLHSFDHVSLPQWLSEADEWGYGRAGRFMVDRTDAAKRIHRWALAQATSQQAHTWPYLVRHLASHLTEEEQPEMIAGLLGEFTWVEARLRQEGINALLEDFDLAAPRPWLIRLEQALRQGSHVLSHTGDWEGHRQLASQLLLRLDDDDSDAKRLREQIVNWLNNTGRTYPLSPSLLRPKALICTLSAVGDNTQILCIAKTQDQKIISGSADGTIRVWNQVNGKCEASFQAHDCAVLAIIIQGDHIVSGSEDHSIRIWDLFTYDCLDTVRFPGGSIKSLVSIDQRRIACGSNDGAIFIFESSTRNQFSLEHHNGAVEALTNLGNGRLVSGSLDGSVIIWNLSDRKPVFSFEINSSPKLGTRPRILSLKYSDKDLLVIASERIAIFSCTESSFEEEYSLDSDIGLVLSLCELDSSQIAYGTADGQIGTWRYQNCNLAQSLNDAHSGWINGIIGINDSAMASCSDDGTIRLWNTILFDSESKPPSTHRTQVSDLLVLDDENVAVASGSDIRIWDTATLQAVNSLPIQRGHVWSLMESSAGEVMYISMTFPGNLISIWDVNSQSISDRLLCSHGFSRLCRLSDGRFVISAGRSLYVSIGGINSNGQLQFQLVFEGGESSILSLVSICAGQLAAILAEGIYIWDTTTWQSQMIPDSASANALAATSEGLLLSGSDDTIRVWNANRLECKVTLPGLNEKINCLIDLGNGLIATGSHNNTIQIWNLSQPEESPELVLVADGPITTLASHSARNLLIAGDRNGNLYWLRLPCSSSL
jgi:WD40 repeat protein